MSRESADPFLARRFGPDLADDCISRSEAVLARHGDLPRWQAALDDLPEVETGWRVDGGVLVAGQAAPDCRALESVLAAFIPWRKGPLRLGGVDIDTEWRSDFKWNRIAPHIDLEGQTVLDVGAGNGYFGWRMLGHGAGLVVGCDPSALFVIQHRVISRYAGTAPNRLLALRLEELPATLHGFDTVFSMGVLHHHRDPPRHLVALKARLRPGGRLVLESLVIPGDGADSLAPATRYARMGNVHLLPTVALIERWLDAAGFREIACVDRSWTGTAEQRSTRWMPFDSLARALGPDGLTVEGHPPPYRAMLIAST